MRFRRTAVTAFAFALAAVAVSCGSDDDETTSTTQAGGSSSSSTTALKGEPVKIGIIAPGKGTGVIAGETSVAAVRAAVDGVNKRGGIGGRPLEVEWCNERNDPNQAEACARKMVDDKVIFQAGGVSLSGAQITKIMAAANVAQVGITAIDATELNSPNVFVLGTTVPGYYVSLGYVNKLGKKMSLVNSDNPTASRLISALEGSAQAIRNPFVSKTPVPPQIADISPMVAAAIRENPDYVLDLMGQDQSYLFSAALAKTSNKTTKVIAATPVNPTKIAEIGGPEMADRRITFSNFIPLNSDNPVMKLYREDMAAAKAKGIEGSDLSEQGATTYSSWLSVWVFQQMVERGILKADNITPQSFMAALNSMKDFDMGGVMPAWTPSKPGPEGLSRVSSPFYYMIGYRKGGTEEYLLTQTAVSPEQALRGEIQPVAGS